MTALRVLILGPRADPAAPGDGGSLPPYLDVLTAALRRHGAAVARVGSTGVPYDSTTGAIWDLDRISAAADTVLADLHRAVAAGRPDVLAVHAGNLEVDQLTAARWVAAHPTGAALGPAVVHHVHTLAPTLLTTHRPAPHLHAAVQAALDRADELITFGRYAHDQLVGRLRPGAPTAVCPLPTTIPAGTPPVPGPELRRALADLAGHPGPLVTLYGYAAPWKDAATLLDALARTRAPLRMLLAGPLWDDPDQAGAELPAGPATVGAARLRVAPTYLHAGDRAALTTASDLALFPYRAHPAFQGSGAIADYLADGVPAVVTDVANMAELLGDPSDVAGCVVPPGDPAALADALDRHRRDGPSWTVAARRRAARFSADRHARDCLRLYAAL